MNYSGYREIIKRIAFNLNYNDYIKMDKKCLDLIIIYDDVPDKYTLLSNKELHDMLDLFSNGKYFQNPTYVNYNEIMKNLKFSCLKNIKMINIQMLYDFYDFFRKGTSKNMSHLKFLSVDFSDYIFDFKWFESVIHNIVDTYYKYMLEELLLEYRCREIKNGLFDVNFVSGGWYNRDLVVCANKSLTNLNKLIPKYKFIKLAIFKISVKNILVLDIFNIIFNISLKIGD